MSGIAGSANANVIAARATFEALAEGALSRAGAESQYQRVVREKTGVTGDKFVWTIPGGSPDMQRWVGSQKWSGARILEKEFPVEEQSAGLELKRSRVDYDRDGAISELMRQFFQNTEYFKDRLTFSTLSSNPLGADQVALISGSHPYGPSGATWSNDAGAALSFAAYNTAQVALRNRRDERDVGLNLKGDTLLYNPQDRRIAGEIIASGIRPTAVTNAGAFDGTSNVVGATGVDNVLAGEVVGIETTYLAAGDWLLIDSRYPPLGMVIWRDITTVILDSLTDYDRAENDLYKYKLESDIKVDGLEPWGVQGRIQ